MKKLVSDYHPDSGTSIVIIQKGQETYIGATELSPEDQDVASSFAGCFFAELKANIQIAKAAYKEERNKLETLENAYQQISQLRDFSAYKHSQPVRHLRKIIRMQTARVEDLKNLYIYLKENYPKTVEARLAAARRLPTTLLNAEQRKKIISEGSIF